MTLQDVLEQLTFGEFHALTYKDSNSEDISPDHYRKVVAHINLGLKELYKRFWLSSKELVIQLYSHIIDYELDRRFAFTNVTSNEVYKYILDTAENPFYNDVMEIEQVYDEEGTAMYLNDITRNNVSDHTEYSLFTPNYKTIKVPTLFALAYPGSLLEVHYRASHPIIETTACLDPSSTEIKIPDGLLEALILYVGSRAQSAIGGVEAQQEAMLLQQKFEASCQMALAQGIGITHNYTNIKLDSNGWV